MYKLKTTAAFDSAHFLSGYNGKCANIHGHTWTVEVTVSEARLITEGEKRGMVIDFSDLKKAVRALADSFDHTLIYERGTLRESTLRALRDEGFSLTEFPDRPTAENFARYFYERLSAQLPVSSVAVYETPHNCATYEEES
jgi:6-pyruvoyltetrahydropterin/6-carboxytetrahydropterin synthase